MMRTFFLILFVSLAAVSRPAAAQAQLPFPPKAASVGAHVSQKAETPVSFIVRVKSDRVYLRAGQNVNYETVALVNKGETLVVLSKSYGWLKVKLPPQAKAYLKAEYVTMVTPEIGEIKPDKLNVRCLPNTNATIIGQLAHGNRFYVLSRDKEWIVLKPVDSLFGWVKEEFVDPVKGASVPTKLYPDPQIAPTTAAKPSAPFLLRKLENGRVEARGTLTKDQAGYRVVKDNAIVCVVVGPAAVLDPFVNGTIKVQGTLDGAVTDTDPPRVKLEKINFLLP